MRSKYSKAGSGNNIAQPVPVTVNTVGGSIDSRRISPCSPKGTVIHPHKFSPRKSKNRMPRWK